jgi:hypothetical protein
MPTSPSKSKKTRKKNPCPPSPSRINKSNKKLSNSKRVTKSEKN